MAPGDSAYNDMFILNISRSRVDGQHGILAKWESLAMQIEGDLPCPRSRQVRACFAFTEMQEHICAPISAGNSIDGGSWFETIEEPPRHVPS